MAVDCIVRRPHPDVGAPDPPRGGVDVDAGVVTKAGAKLDDGPVRGVLLRGDVDCGAGCGRVDKREANAWRGGGRGIEGRAPGWGLLLLGTQGW